MQKKDDKVGKKIANKEERQRKKRERQRKIEIDSPKKINNFGFCASVKNKKVVSLRQISRKICLFSCKTHF